MKKTELLQALQTEIRHHTFDTFVDQPPSSGGRQRSRDPRMPGVQDNMIDITKLSAKTKTALVRFSKAKQAFDKLMRQQYIDASGTVATEYLHAREALTSCSEPEIANLLRIT